MREIKFRMWHKKNSEFLDRFYINKNLDVFFFENNGAHVHMHLPNTEKYDELEIMQYTGLKDKNGKEIYEGDVLKCKEGQEITYYVCIFQDLGFIFKHTTSMLFLFNAVIREQYNYEVIGNIYENPNLLENK